jgi:hypothetical protein
MKTRSDRPIKHDSSHSVITAHATIMTTATVSQRQNLVPPSVDLHVACCMPKCSDSRATWDSVQRPSESLKFFPVHGTRAAELWSEGESMLGRPLVILPAVLDVVARGRGGGTGNRHLSIQLYLRGYGGIKAVLQCSTAFRTAQYRRPCSSDFSLSTFTSSRFVCFQIQRQTQAVVSVERSDVCGKVGFGKVTRTIYI